MIILKQGCLPDGRCYFECQAAQGDHATDFTRTYDPAPNDPDAMTLHAATIMLDLQAEADRIAPPPLTLTPLPFELPDPQTAGVTVKKAADEAAAKAAADAAAAEVPVDATPITPLPPEEQKV